MTDNKNEKSDGKFIAVVVIIVFTIWGTCGGLDTVLKGEGNFLGGFFQSILISAAVIIVLFLAYSMLSSKY